jgi:hypothetical protein
MIFIRLVRSSDVLKLDKEDTEAKGLVLEKIWDEKPELSDLLLKLYDRTTNQIGEPSFA